MTEIIGDWNVNGVSDGVCWANGVLVQSLWVVSHNQGLSCITGSSHA